MMYLVDHIGLGLTYTRVDNSYLILNDFFELPIHQESEIIVPYSDTVELVETIRDVVLKNSFPVNYITEVCDADVQTATYHNSGCPERQATLLNVEPFSNYVALGPHVFS